MSASDRKMELLKEWPKGYVDSPGKFEGEPIAALYYWDLVMDGGGDDTLMDGETPVDVFTVDADDRALWGFDADTTYVALYETSQGFVMFHEWTDIDYQEASTACQDEDEDSDSEPDEDSITTKDHREFYQYNRLVLEQSRVIHTSDYLPTWFWRDEKGSRFLLGTFGDDHVAALNAYMNVVQFYPNVFFISDHGNAHLIDLSGGAK